MRFFTNKTDSWFVSEARVNEIERRASGGTRTSGADGGERNERRRRSGGGWAASLSSLRGRLSTMADVAPNAGSLVLIGARGSERVHVYDLQPTVADPDAMYLRAVCPALHVPQRAYRPQCVRRFPRDDQGGGSSALPPRPGARRAAMRAAHCRGMCVCQCAGRGCAWARACAGPRRGCSHTIMHVYRL